MSKTKNKPGIHLHKSYHWEPVKKGNGFEGKPEWYWNIVASNGRIIARSSETYTRKSGAVKSIRTVAQLFYFQAQDNGFRGYYDHTKPNLPLESYL